ncbi:hypothetical protein [Nocardia caishijiensis]|uniref:Uncharacterized protein n=1 Tax=Nocardia caishijiensis TaxID=184756 RepID=A0ABQ6YGZ1_9NOCA|nr:hypothetical protein [Nocardia caishijiensis]KAF0844774.1 hypothetical protein FNL39_1106 [Nocardia caishijiensis]
MPDWTYHPLRPVANALVGERRAQRCALGLLGTLSALPGGAATIRRVFDHPRPPEDWAGRLGATVPVAAARQAIRALPPQGAGFVEVGPVDATTVTAVRDAARGRRCRVVARVSDDGVAADLADAVDDVLVGETAGGRIYLTDPDITAAVRALAIPGTTVVATTAVLVAAGPGWFQRVIEAAAPAVSRAPTLRDVPLDPRRWPGWFWSLLVGIGMVVAGLGAAAITLGPVLLWYDRDYLGTDVDGLHRINHHLVHFLQHDRITMAGNMIAIGSLYIGLAWGGIRRGWAWARTALMLSGLVGFPTLFYFLFIGFVEPLHVAVTVVLFPMFLLGVRHTPGPPCRRSSPPCEERVRRRALIGQLLVVGTGLGVVIGGIVISTIGLTVVFVPTDLAFLHADADTLRAANAHLLPFIAHDRAGFGGALVATGVGILLIGMWGWRQGEAWVWWSLLGAATAGSVSALAVHFLIHYTAFIHLLPVYVGTALLIVALSLSRAFLVEA